MKLVHDVRRSTLADANQRRPEKFFGDLFHNLYKYYYASPDSRKINRREPYEKRLFIIDSTTIKLFHDVLKAAGRPPVSGKSKGGMKAHVMINASEDTPCLALLTGAAANDRVFLKEINLPRGSIITFDKGYSNFRKFDRWSKDGITWVSRAYSFWNREIYKERNVSEDEKNKGVISDKLAILGDSNNRNTLKIRARLIKYKDDLTGKIFEFVTNNTKFLPSKIADIYRNRWQIELLFKRIKQRYPLKYFLGESENAIKIQVWCALIIDLLVKIMKDKVKRNWSYANLCGLIRLHILTYINLIMFLENPDKTLKNYHPPPAEVIQLKMFH